MSTYFEKIGFQKTPLPDYETLRELHQLHTQMIPFENLTPFLHQEVSLDPEQLSKKMLVDGRGGYCFEQNLLFKQVLESIGFKVKGLGARVLWNQAEETITRRSHMLLTVEIKGETYLADVGFGGLTLTTPIKFTIGEAQSTTHEDFRIEKLENDYKLQANVDGNWKTLYRFDTQEQYLPDYEVANYFLSTNPSSPFRNTLIAARPFTGGRLALRNTDFSTYYLDGRTEKQQLKTIEEIKEKLTTEFNLRLPESESLNNRLAALLDLH